MPAGAVSDGEELRADVVDAAAWVCCVAVDVRMKTLVPEVND